MVVGAAVATGGYDDSNDLGPGADIHLHRALDNRRSPTPSPTPEPTPPEPQTAPGTPDGAAEPEDNVVVEGREIDAIICAYPWECATALRIAICESGMRADAISWTGESYGVFQIHYIHAYRFPGFWENWMKPEVNIAWAYALYLERGWTPWVCAW